MLLTKHKKRKLRIRSHLLKKSLMENFIFCALRKAKTWKIDIKTDLQLRSQEFLSLIKESVGNIGDDVRHKIQWIILPSLDWTKWPTLEYRERKRFIRFDSLDYYSSTRNVLTLPNLKLIKSYFGHFGSEGRVQRYTATVKGSVQKCTATVKSVFANLSSKQLYCKVLLDEMHIKPSFQYKRGPYNGKLCQTSRMEIKNSFSPS